MSHYNIIVNIKTAAGILEVGNFLIGDDDEFARATFSSLKGNNNINDGGILRMDLIETKNQALPLLLESITCSLDQYLENCRIVTRDVFKFFTMENKNFDLIYRTRKKSY